MAYSDIFYIGKLCSYWKWAEGESDEKNRMDETRSKNGLSSAVDRTLPIMSFSIEGKIDLYNIIHSSVW